MKRSPAFIILFFLIINSRSSIAQNLVPNGSFEDITQCPWAQMQLDFAYPWTTPQGLGCAIPGSGIICGSSELWHSCSATWGPIYQKPRNNGKGYAGCFFFLHPTYPGNEYIEVELKDSLINGKTYCVNFYVSLIKLAGYATSEMSVCFTKKIISDTTYFPLSKFGYIPQVNNSNGIIKDTANWVLISGSYTSQGGEKFITIGNFKSDSVSNYEFVNYGQFPANYFIDDVSVYPCDAPVYYANAGGNKEICGNNSVILGISNLPEYYYWWYDQNKNIIDTIGQITVKPAVTTKYYLKVRDFKFDVTWDSVIVTVNEFCNYIVFIPNIFSPNSDGANDILYLRGENIKEATISIYNRWGEKVYESNDITKGWDGTYKDKPCPAEVYVYYVNVTFINGVTEQKNGNITLVR